MRSADAPLPPCPATPSNRGDPEAVIRSGDRPGRDAKPAAGGRQIGPGPECGNRSCVAPCRDGVRIATTVRRPTRAGERTLWAPLHRRTPEGGTAIPFAKAARRPDCRVATLDPPGCRDCGPSDAQRNHNSSQGGLNCGCSALPGARRVRNSGPREVTQRVVPAAAGLRAAGGSPSAGAACRWP